MCVLTCVKAEGMQDEPIEERWPCCVNPIANSRKNLNVGARLRELSVGMHFRMGTNILIAWDIPTRINDSRYDDKSNQAYDHEYGWHIFFRVIIRFQYQ